MLKNRFKAALISVGSAVVLAALALNANAAVTYDTVFSATNAKDVATQVITDNQAFALYGLAAVAALMIALAWFKRITRGVARGKVK